MFIAISRLRCWLRSCVEATTMPVGRWVMRTADSVLLTCWPPAPEARKVSILRSCRVDLDLDACRPPPDRPRREAKRSAAAPRVEGLMRTRRCTPDLGLQPAIGVGPDDLDGRGLDARLLARLLSVSVDLVACALGPAGVHAQQHLGPVLGLGAAGAGVDSRGSSRCRRPRRRAPRSRAGRARSRRPERRPRPRRRHLGIALGLAQLDQLDSSRSSAARVRRRPRSLGQLLALAHDLLGRARDRSRGRGLGARRSAPPAGSRRCPSPDAA
ncbi:MAG: hypothetical protein KatS3mg118_2921 [Paracoccaceae bacterium]|nr:MAG: hypothetical protein KatS3mg118_2921 [Paracoccaceae bacterium]